MSKTYLCEKIINFVKCGETDPEKFSSGRYSKCKKCRNIEIYEIKEKKKENHKIEEENVLDPDSNFKKLFEINFKKLPIHDGKTIKDIYEQILKEVSQISETSHIFTIKKDIINKNFENLCKKNDDLYNHFSNMNNYCRSLEERVKILENELNEQKYINDKFEGRLKFLEKNNNFKYEDVLKENSK